MIIDAPNATTFERAFGNRRYANINKLVINAPNVTNYSQLFYECHYAVIKELTIDFTSVSNLNLFCSQVSTQILMANIKFGTKATSATNKLSLVGCVKDINASGEIGNVSWSFADISTLTAESAIGIINCLVDYAGTDKEGAYTVSFHANTKTALEALGAVSPNGNTWLEYIGDKGWLYA